MPRFNSRADILMGGGGEQGSLNGTYYPFRSYGGGAFVDDDTILVAADAEDGDLVLWRPGSLPVPLEPRIVANAEAGGGGQWIAWANLRDGAWLYGSMGTRRFAGFGDVAFDGTIAFKTIHQANTGLTIITPGTREEVTLPEAAPVDVQALPGGQCVWRGGARGRAPLRPYHADAMGTRLATVGGVDWICYWSNAAGALILHRDGEDHGLVLETDGRAFNHDIVADGIGVKIVWSATQGERPQDIVLLRMIREQVTILFDWQPARPVPQWQSLAPVEPPIDVPVAIGRPLWCGCFVFGPGLGPFGNCYLPVNPEMMVRGLGGTPIARYAASEGLGPELDLIELEALIVRLKAMTPTLPVLAYWTYKAQSMRVPRGADMVLIELYWRLDESLADLERRGRVAAAQHPKPWIGAQCYTSNLGNHSDLRPLPAVYARLAKTIPRVQGILAFSAGTRPTGWDAHPEVWGLWDTLADGIPSAPDILPPTPVDPPIPPQPKPSDELENVNMAGKILGLIGPGGLYARIDPNSKTTIHFDAHTVGGHERYEAVPIAGDTRYLLRAEAADVILSGDATKHGSEKIEAQFSVRTKPWSPGHYEMWTIKKDPDSGIHLAFIRYKEQGAVVAPWIGAQLTVVPQ